jgi:hypothetical protein
MPYGPDKLGLKFIGAHQIFLSPVGAEILTDKSVRTPDFFAADPACRGEATLRVAEQKLADFGKQLRSDA